MDDQSPVMPLLLRYRARTIGPAELALIRAEKAQAATAEQAGQSSISKDVIRYLYRLRAEERRP